MRSVDLRIVLPRGLPSSAVNTIRNRLAYSPFHVNGTTDMLDGRPALCVMATVQESTTNRNVCAQLQRQIGGKVSVVVV